MTVAALLSAVPAMHAAGGNTPANLDPTTGKGAEWGKAAPIGLLVIVLLCVAVYFLVKSMNRNIKKVPLSFDPPVVSSDSEDGASAGEPAGEPAARKTGRPLMTSGESPRQPGERPDSGPSRR